MDGPPPPSPSSLQPVLSLPSQIQNVRRANYALDRTKQVSRICKDTKIDDFDITVSPIAHNVTIKCSTGFYTKVVLPTFTDMTLQYCSTVNGVKIQCIKIEGQTDETGASVTTQIKFELKYEHDREKPSVGIVAVHLHHTARKVQLQGSSLVHGQVRAPVWFVDYFLKGIFNFYAREKAIDITKFNETVHDILSNHLQKTRMLEKCGICESLLVGRSVLVSCPTCKKKFHKNCSTDNSHSCPQSLGTPPMSITTSTSVHPGTDQDLALSTVSSLDAPTPTP